MSFTIDDFHDLVRLLDQRPERRAELLRLVLTDELLSLTEANGRLVAAQDRTDTQLGQLATDVHQLRAAQQGTDAQLQRLSATVDRWAGTWTSLPCGSISWVGISINLPPGSTSSVVGSRVTPEAEGYAQAHGVWRVAGRGEEPEPAAS